MTRNPIQAVSDKFQYRAIGIIKGLYKPHNEDNINKGIIKDREGDIIETVVLGKTLPLIRKYIDLKKDHYWIVYPRNKDTTKLHLQIMGIWDPANLNNNEDSSSKDNEDLLNVINLQDNFFSIRGKLIYVNSQEKEIIIKVLSSNKNNKQSNNSFKVFLKGEIPMRFINSFVSADTIRKGNSLKLTKYEVIEAN